MEFYDNASGRSPRSYRGPSMNRSHGRPDAFGSMQGMYGTENGMHQGRFGNMRDPFAAPSNLGAVNMNLGNFPYDSNAASTWSAPPPMTQFSGSNMNNVGQNGDFGPSRSVKPSRGRIGLQGVRNVNPKLRIPPLT